jgi:transposase-like protein
VTDFKGRHFEGEIVLWAVRWYCRYGVGYRDLEQMMGERGISVDHGTIYRWVRKYAPGVERRLRWQWRQPRSTSSTLEKIAESVTPEAIGDISTLLARRSPTY